MSLTFGTRDSSGAVTEKMRIVSSGTVAIGTQVAVPTPHPGSNVGGLIVQGLNGCRGLIEVWDATSGKAIFQQVAGTTYLGNLCKGVSGGDLQLLVNGSGTVATAAMVLTCQGHVLINNSAQNGCADYSRMTISSTFPKTSSCTAFGVSVLHLSSCENDYPFGAKFGIYGDACSTNRYLSIQTGDHNITNQGNIVLQPSGGNVGIGTTTPISTLEIKGQNTYHKIAACFFSTYNAGFAFSDYNAGITYDAGGNTMCLYSNYTGYGGIVLSTCGSPRVFVNVGGNVSIGTTSSNFKLSLKEGGVSGAPLFGFIGNASNGSWMRGYWYCSDETTQLAQLTVQPGDNMYFGSTVNMPLVLQSNGSEKMRITSNGTIQYTGNFSGGNYYTADTTPSMCMLSAGQCIHFCYMSGMLLVNDWNNGSTTLYVAGGGSTTMVANAVAQTGCFWYNPTVVGYSWSNTSGTTRCYGFFVVRTRTNA